MPIPETRKELRKECALRLCDPSEITQALPTPGKGDEAGVVVGFGSTRRLLNKGVCRARKGQLGELERKQKALTSFAPITAGVFHT
jgi:hypothetical protein